MYTKGFYYFGLDKELPLTSIASSLKENIYSFSLQTKTDSRIKVFSEGTQACRYDIMEGKNTLIVDNQWDYVSLLWGNYMKLIPLEKEYSGSVVLTVSKQLYLYNIF